MVSLSKVSAFILISLTLVSPAAAKHRLTAPAVGSGCSQNNDGRTICLGRSIAYQAVISKSPQTGEIGFIPSPGGCHRVSQSCACRLAAYWGLGEGLDKVSTWPSRYARVDGPGIGIAAVRGDQHHIIGIDGGGPGAWRVVDFNSGGHLNRSYTVADFRGYFFVNPHAPKYASR